MGDVQSLFDVHLPPLLFELLDVDVVVGDTTTLVVGGVGAAINDDVGFTFSFLSCDCCCCCCCCDCCFC